MYKKFLAIVFCIGMYGIGYAENIQKNKKNSLSDEVVVLALANKLEEQGFILEDDVQQVLLGFNENKNSNSKIVAASISFLTVCIIGGVCYYYMSHNTAKKTGAVNDNKKEDIGSQLPLVEKSKLNDDIVSTTIVTQQQVSLVESNLQQPIENVGDNSLIILPQQQDDNLQVLQNNQYSISMDEQPGIGDVVLPINDVGGNGQDQIAQIASVFHENNLTEKQLSALKRLQHRWQQRRILQNNHDVLEFEQPFDPNNLNGYNPHARTRSEHRRNTQILFNNLPEKSL